VRQHNHFIKNEKKYILTAFKTKRRQSKSILSSPLINKVVYLNKILVEYGHKLPSGRIHKTKEGNIVATVDVKRCYLYPLLDKLENLFVQAFRQLKGKDYTKRMIENVEEIQAQAYLITELKGWSPDKCATIDMLCDDILDDLYKYNTK
jgi:hypothetical protein